MDRKEAIEKIMAIVAEIDQPEQEQKRWWFCPECKNVSEQGYVQCLCKIMPLEVTESYARYLQNKPEGECELRKPVEGEIVLTVHGKAWERAQDYTANSIGIDDLGYRWVKTSALKIVDVVNGVCKGWSLILGAQAFKDTDDSNYHQAGYIYDNGQESPHSWLWKDPNDPKHHYAGCRSKRFCKEVTPVQVVCAKRGGK